MSTQRVAVVTGGAAGIGWSICQRFARDGFHVVAADLVPGGTQNDTSIEWACLDVTDAAAVDAMVADVVNRHGRIDVMINNAGIQRHRPLESLPWDEWSAVVDVNLNGVFSCLRAAGRAMLAQGGGAIVNIASISARGSAGRAPYSATKAAVIALTATAGAEWAQRGVRVNAIAPGYVDTGVFRQGVAAGTLDPKRILSRIPAGRLAQAEEIAAAAAYLASDDATYVCGQTLYVDGGFSVDYGVPLQWAGVS